MLSHREQGGTRAQPSRTNCTKFGVRDRWVCFLKKDLRNLDFSSIKLSKKLNASKKLVQNEHYIVLNQPALVFVDRA